MLLGLRGVGKTVLLNRIAEIAEYLLSLMEAQEGRALVEMLASQLRTLLFRLSASEKARAFANGALATLRSIASVFKVSVGDIEVGVEADPSNAATGDFET